MAEWPSQSFDRVQDWAASHACIGFIKSDIQLVLNQQYREIDSVASRYFGGTVTEPRGGSISATSDAQVENPRYNFDTRWYKPKGSAIPTVHHGDIRTEQFLQLKLVFEL